MMQDFQNITTVSINFDSWHVKALTCIGVSEARNTVKGSLLKLDDSWMDPISFKRGQYIVKTAEESLTASNLKLSRILKAALFFCAEMRVTGKAFVSKTYSSFSGCMENTWRKIIHSSQP